MNKLICGTCENESFVKLNPDEDKCINCGKVHEKLSDYKIIKKN